MTNTERFYQQVGRGARAHWQQIDYPNIQNNTTSNAYIHPTKLAILPEQKPCKAFLTKYYLNLDQIESSRSLEISCRSIHYVPNSLFKLTYLESLCLSNDSLTTIPSELCQLSQLRSLDISKNRLTVVPNVFKSLSQLEQLDISNNRITIFSDNLCKLTQLKILDISGNKITALPNDLHKLTQLHTLNISHTGINHIPNKLSQLEQLQYLHVCGNKITSISDNLAKFKKLHSLYISNNSITTLSNLAAFENLRFLQIRTNRMTTITDEICLLKQLETLDIAVNLLTQIPVSLCKLSQLCVLIAGYNQITHIPNEIRQLTRLSRFDITSNKLNELPIALIYMQNLTTFTCYGNEISYNHPALRRWMNRSKTTQNVYSNSQSVHDASIEASTNKSIIAFVTSYKPKMQQPDLTKLLKLINVTAECKSLLIMYAQDKYIHSVVHLTFAEVVIPVLDYISTHVDKKDLEKILNDEMLASKGKCFQGRLSRLINVLSGYHESVCIKISDNEQIANVIIGLKKRIFDLDELVRAIEVEIKERGFSSSVIDEWCEHVRENY